MKKLWSVLLAVLFLFTALPLGAVSAATEDTLTVAQAIDMGLAKDHNTFTEEKYTVTGVITEVYNIIYGNMRITDDAGNILTLYGTYNADGTLRYDVMDVQPVAGDTITVYGIIGQYNGTPQMKNGWIIEHTAVDNSGEQPAGPKITLEDAPVAGTAYKFGMVQGNVSHTDVYYLTGNMSGYYMETTTSAASALDVYLEETAGGYYLYAMIGGAKTYINMVVSGTHVDGAYEASASTVYTFDTDSYTLIAEIDGAPYWFGTRNDKAYTTVGPCNVEFQGFYCQFYSVKESAPSTPEEPSIPDEPFEPSNPPAPAWVVAETLEADVAYKLGLDQTTKGAVYYFTGAMSSYYGATETDVALAVDMYVEIVDGGYKLFFNDANGAKQYICLVQSGTHYNFTFGADASIFTLDTEKNALCAPCGDQICYMGTYGNFVTMGTLTSEKLKDGDYLARLYVQVEAEGGSDSDTNLTYVIWDSQVIITGYKGDLLNDLVLPDTIKGYPVTTIGNSAFSSCTYLTTLVIPDSVTTIGGRAFANCNRLSTVYYYGTPADQAAITMGSSNSNLTSATWHYFTDACDRDCDECGYVREVPHQYTDVCDAVCDLCAFPRKAPHVYDNDCDDTCAGCGATRIPQAHRYSTVCDIDCNECGAVREASPHRYDNACDSFCDECGALRVPADHVYDTVCDTNCNECGIGRWVSHVYDTDCDEVCNLCDFTRTVAHTYDNTCDIDCNICGMVRAITHTYSDACDALCNVCKAEREAPHNYANQYDDVCDTCGWYRDVLSNNDPAADTELSIVEAIELGLSKGQSSYTEGKYYVTGKVVGISNDIYGNLYIADEDNNMLLIYGSFSADGAIRFGDMEEQPEVGDTITVYGIVGTYNGTEAQMKNVWITEIVKGEGVENTDPAADSLLTIKDAIALGASKLHNIFTTDKYYVYGQITEIYNDIYGNMYITDAEGNILTIYGTYDATGELRFDGMETQPQVGDYVHLYGIIGQYGGNAQMKNGWIIAINPAENPYDADDSDDSGDDSDDSGDDGDIDTDNGGDIIDNSGTLGGNVPGDLTGDGKINVRDLGLLQQYLNGWDVAVNEKAADVTADGKVNVRDLGLLQQYLNGWDVELKDYMPLVTDEDKILADAFALGENECTPYIAELTGKVLQTEAYNEQYGSITLTIQVGDKTIECYQMKGYGIDKVKAGDTLTVRGVIKNYFYEGATKGKVEFAWHEASGTEVRLVKLVSVAGQDLSTPAKILAAAQNLKNGESLQKDVTLTGEVLDVETPYDPEYDNVTVNIRVNGVDIKCYRLKGNGIDKIKSGDTITVNGRIKNYNGSIEFDTGCQMTKRVAGKDTSEKLSVVESPKAGVAYKFGMVQEKVNKDTVYYLKGGMSGYYFATSSSSAAAVDVYLEETSGGYYLYAMVSGKKQYINMVVSGIHVNPAYGAAASTVYTYDTTAKTLVAEMTSDNGTALYWFGTRNDKSYTTVGPCKTEQEGFYCQFYA